MTTLPRGAVDSHLHILRPDLFPYPVAIAAPPPVASVAQYRMVQEALGLARAVVVTPSNYGTDNRCTISAIAELGLENARGIAVVEPEADPADLRHLDDCGIHGVRINATRPGGTALSDLPRLAHTVEPFGWHIQLHVSPEALAAVADIIPHLPVQVSLDHLARIPASGYTGATGFETVCRLLDTGRVWIKVGGGYHVSAEGAPFFSDALALAADLIHRYPDRALWHTDWPHTPALRGDLPTPDDRQQLESLLERIDQSEADRLFVANPCGLYGFTRGYGAHAW